MHTKRECLKLLIFCALIASFALMWSTSVPPAAKTLNAVNDNNGNNIPPTKQKENLTPRLSLLNANLSSVLELLDNVNESLHPAIAVDSKKNVHVVWDDAQFSTSNQNKSIFYRMFNYTTYSWGPVVNLTQSIAPVVMCQYPDITVDKNDNIHICWEGETAYGSNIFNIYYVNKTASTGVWGSIIDVTGDIGNEHSPKIAVNSTGAIQIVWEEGNLPPYYLRGRCGTTGDWNTADPSYTVYQNPSYGITPYEFDLAADSHFFHLTWVLQTTPNQVYYLNSSQGLLQDPSLTISIPIHGGALTETQPTIFVNNATGGYSNVSIAWASNIDGNYDILTKNASMGSKPFTFGTVVNVTLSNSIDFKSPKLAFDNKTGLMFVLFTENNPYYLYLTNSSAYGQFTEMSDPYRNHGNDVLADPTLTVDTNGSLCFAWEDGEQLGTNDQYYGHNGGPFDNCDIFFREYDRFTPQVKINSPGNLSIIGNTTQFQGTCEPCTRFVNLSFQVLGQGTWHTMGGVENDTNNFRNGWSFTWNAVNNTFFNVTNSYANITIRANATDFSGTSDQFLIYNETLDTAPPSLANLVNITDSFNNVYYNPSNYNNTNFTAVVTITYATSGGNVTLWNGINSTLTVANVTLWNGTNILVNKHNGSPLTNTSNTQIVFNNDGFDGSYTALHLNATDLGGNWNVSVTIPYNVTFNNHVDPSPNFNAPYDNWTILNNNPLENKLTHTFTLSVNATASQNDSYWKQVNFFNSSDGIVWNNFGNATSRTNGNWTIAFPSLFLVDVAPYYFKAQVFDWSNRNTTAFVNVRIDNKAPNITVYINDILLQGAPNVGFQVVFRVMTDIDAVDMNVYNASTQPPFNPSSWDLLTTPSSPTTSNSTPDTTGYPGYNAFMYTWNTYAIASQTVYVRIEVTDDVGNMNETSDIYSGFELVLEHNTPATPINVTATLITGNRILITWVKSDNSDLRLRGYRLFRLEFAPDINFLNLMNPFNVPALYSFFATNAILVADTDKLTPDTTNYTDGPLDPNTYYYIVFAVNIFNNPSQIYTGSANAQIPAQEPVRQPDQRFGTAVTYVIMYLIAIWVILPFAGISAGRRAGKRELIDFTMDANVIKKFKGGTTASFDSDVADLDAKMRKELGIGGTAPSETDFLSQEVVKTVVPGVEMKETGMRNCPKCGWVLSAGATKCIRCGYVLGEDAPQGGEGN